DHHGRADDAVELEALEQEHLLDVVVVGCARPAQRPAEHRTQTERQQGGHDSTTFQSSCVVTKPPAMKLSVVTRLGRSRFERPKIPWPLVQPPPSRVPKPMNSPPTNIQAILPAGPSASASSSMPSAQVGCQPPVVAAETAPPMTRPKRNGSRQRRASHRLARSKERVRTTRLQTASKPVEIPSRRVST